MLLIIAILFGPHVMHFVFHITQNTLHVPSTRSRHAVFFYSYARDIPQVRIMSYCHVCVHGQTRVQRHRNVNVRINILSRHPRGDGGGGVKTLVRLYRRRCISNDADSLQITICMSIRRFTGTDIVVVFVAARKYAPSHNVM